MDEWDEVGMEVPLLAMRAPDFCVWTAPGGAWLIIDQQGRPFVAMSPAEIGEKIHALMTGEVKEFKTVKK